MTSLTQRLATTRDVLESMATELSMLKRSHRLSQERLAKRIHTSETRLSHWINGHDPISHSAAEALDREFGPASFGSWVELRHRWDDLRQRERFSAEAIQLSSSSRESHTVDTPCDVFFSVPMAATPDRDSYAKHRRDALIVASALREHCGFESLYYAGERIDQRDDFEAPDLALEVNVQALRTSRYFVLLMTEELTTPSSVFVEAGFALALSTPSCYFVREGTRLPFLLQQAAQARLPRMLPTVKLYRFDGIDEIVRLLRVHGRNLFHG